MQLPKYIYETKKSTYLRILLCSFLLSLFAWAIWKNIDTIVVPVEFHSHFRTLLIVCFTVLVFTIIKDLAGVKKKKPLIRLYQEGIFFYGKYFSELGIVKWKDINSCAVFKIGWKNERFLFIDVKDREIYIDQITNKSKRKKFIKLSNKEEETLLWLNTAKLDFDLKELKKIIHNQINNQTPQIITKPVNNNPVKEENFRINKPAGVLN